MNCPVCKKPTIVIDTRAVNGGRERKRTCAENHISFTQEQFIEKWNYRDPRRKRVPAPKASLKKTKLKKWKGIQLNDSSPLWLKNIWERTK